MVRKGVRRCRFKWGAFGRVFVASVIVLTSSWLALAQSAMFDSIPPILGKDYPSDGFEMGHIFEIGDRITLAGTNRNLGSVTVVLSSFAHTENFGGLANYSYPITLRIYEGGFVSIPGPLLANVTQSFSIPYRPVGWASNGIAFTVTFDLGRYGISVPDSVVYTVSVDTSHFGANPTGAPMAQNYDLLGFAYSSASVNCGGLKIGGNDPSDIFDSRDSENYYWDRSAPSATLRRDRSAALLSGPATPMVQFLSSTNVVPIAEVFVTGRTNFQYNGSAQGPTNVTVIGSAGSVILSYKGIRSTSYPASQAPPVAAGIYTVTAQVIEGGSRVSGVSKPMVFVIAPRPLTIRANPIFKAFGSALVLGNVDHGFTSVGLVRGESVGFVNLTATGGTDATDPVGRYLIVPSNANGGSFNPLNYVVSYRPGALDVLPRSKSLVNQPVSSDNQEVPFWPPWAIGALIAPLLGVGLRSLGERR